MYTKRDLILCGLILLVGGIGFSAENEGISSIVDGKVEKVADGFRFTEGPVWHRMAICCSAIFLQTRY